MKSIIIILFILLTQQNYTQDTSIVKYLPLRSGNTWVYTCSAFGSMCLCSKTIRVKTMQPIQKYGKFYFVFSTEIYTQICSGFGDCWNLYLPFDTLRVDSVTGNIYKFVQIGGCSYTPHEILCDSLNARLNDTPYVRCSRFDYQCGDTANSTLFGVLRKTKSFGVEYVDSYKGQTYAKGLGISSFGSGGHVCTTIGTLRGCVIDGIVYGDTSYLTGIININNEIPESFSLSQNYPNPFNPVTNIKFDIPKSGFVQITIFDLLGREVTQLVNQQMQPGSYSVDWDASNYPSGVYFYSFVVGVFKETKRMVLIK